MDMEPLQAPEMVNDPAQAAGHCSSSLVIAPSGGERNPIKFPAPWAFGIRRADYKEFQAVLQNRFHAAGFTKAGPRPRPFPPG